ncbi:MAG: hypothetical protein QOE92_1920 [Chloroflexota bacterium]|jgi:hypothetical protein|nr:hypothetical protein [Chloroflexota bacterium]
MPKFNRISLAGSDELFRPTKVEPEEAAGVIAPQPQADEPAPAERLSGRAVQPPRTSLPARAPLSKDRAYVRVQLSEDQLQVLIDAVQRMKYPHMAAAAHQPSMDEFEALEALRSILQDSLD